MAKPAWDGTPDMDIVFMIGMLFRIVLVTTLLSIVYFVSRRFFRASGKPRSEQASDGKPDTVVS